QRSYDLCVGLHEHVSRFPRAQRGLLGRAILDEGLRMLTLLAATNRAVDRLPGLTEASGRLDALRITLRLSNRLGFLSHGAYERLCEIADEVGRMLGGWIKHGMARRRAPGEAADAAPGAPSSVVTMNGRFVRMRARKLGAGQPSDPIGSSIPRTASRATGKAAGPPP
ncbi:MAG: four helix bundle protein, partial [Deltaproteobacteria bacterium]|nr:four helix bundle protein [Deltaproteobacteria bacterium]